MLSPNIYRTTSEALESFDYITSNGKEIVQLLLLSYMDILYKKISIVFLGDFCILPKKRKMKSSVWMQVDGTFRSIISIANFSVRLTHELQFSVLLKNLFWSVKTS